MLKIFTKCFCFLFLVTCVFSSMMYLAEGGLAHQFKEAAKKNAVVRKKKDVGHMPTLEAGLVKNINDGSTFTMRVFGLFPKMKHKDVPFTFPALQSLTTI